MAEAMFFDTVPVLENFVDVVDPAQYAPAPDDWIVCATDVVGSTRAIADGRFKAVNLAGASAISALMNALPETRFPFAFGGDGATALVPGDAAPQIETALAATRRFCEEELDLDLRAAMVPLSAVRQAGHDIRVARFRVAPAVAYAMFAGGGLAWADTELKAGRFAVADAPPGARPDLTGLSCRWTPITSRAGDIVSLVVKPASDDAGARFADLVRELQTILEQMPRSGHPVPETGPRFGWPPQGLDFEARATHGSDSVATTRRRILIQSFIGWALDRLRIVAGGFDAGHYRRTTGLNTDFRKFADGLHMTLDCDRATRGKIERILDEAQSAGVARYGLVAQDAAVMTCIVPSFLADDHLHFVDGAGGGYASAAALIKAFET